MSKQIREPQQGDITALMKTTLGDIKILLFPDAAPKAVPVMGPTTKVTVPAAMVATLTASR